MDDVTLRLWKWEIDMCKYRMKQAEHDYEYAYWSTRMEGAVAMANLAGYIAEFGEDGKVIGFKSF